jgi:uncharacterized protein (TIGR03086 family)
MPGFIVADVSDPDEQQQLRASDAERQAIADRLNAAGGEGRLTLEEFSDRVGSAYAARTHGELEVLVTDLPAPTGRPAIVVDAYPVPAMPSAEAPSVAPLDIKIGAIKKLGRWRLKKDNAMGVAIGPIKLDLRGADLAAREITLSARTVVGAIKVWCPAAYASRWKAPRQAAAGLGADLARWRPGPLGDTPMRAYAEAADQVITAFTADGVLERQFALPEVRSGQSFPGRIAIGFHLVDYVVHGWDVATSLGVPFELPADVLEAALPIAEAVPGGPSRTMPGAAFAPALPITGEAGTLDKILALLGHSPADGLRPRG